jgi:hypothetical protein
MLNFSGAAHGSIQTLLASIPKRPLMQLLPFVPQWLWCLNACTSPPNVACSGHWWGFPADGTFESFCWCSKLAPLPTSDDAKCRLQVSALRAF